MIKQIVLPSKIDVYTERQEFIDFFKKTPFTGITVLFSKKFSLNFRDFDHLETNSVFIDPKTTDLESSPQDFLKTKYISGKMHFIMPQEEILDFIKITNLPESDIIPLPCDHEIFKHQKKYQLPPIQQQILIPEIDGNSDIVKIFKSKLIMAGESDLPILFLGESGTGKSYAASIIHRLSARRKNKFNTLDIGTLAENLAETELFGSSYGAFTGSVNRKGLLEDCNGGTLFIDEIGNASFTIQAKLLRFVETGKIRSVGSTKEIQTDTRLIFATNANLGELVKEKLFRGDFYNRINVFTIEVEPLRNHPEDIKAITESTLKGTGFSITQKAVSALENYSWPANIRELQNCLKRAMLFCKNKCIEEQDITFC